MSLPRTRWIIYVDDEAGGTQAYGPWYDNDKAEKHAGQLRKRSSRYTGDSSLPHFAVDVVALERWPGIREATS